MARYRRVRVAGGTYFFTVCLADRGSGLLVERIDDLRAAYAATMRERPVRCRGIVVLPDHLHAVWTLPEGDDGYSERWRRIKGRFSHAVRGAHERSDSKVRKRERGVWQRRFWEHVVRDEEELVACIRYCWMNPVKHGLVERVADWPYSSFHRDVTAGRVSRDWSGVQVGDPPTRAVC